MNLSDSLPLARSQKAAQDFYAMVERRGDRLAEGERYQAAKVKVTLICKSGHIFKLKPNGYKYGYGCIKCAGICPEQAAQDFYRMVEERGDLLADGVEYKNNSTYIHLVCQAGHTFVITPNSYKKGDGCGKCSRKCPEQAAQDFYRMVEERGDLLVEGEKYQRSGAKVKLICKSGHTFALTPNHYKRGGGCAYCNPGGFKNEKNAIVYYLEFSPQPGRSVFKIGITNLTVKERYRYTKTPYQVIWVKKFDRGEDAAKMEAEIKRKYDHLRCKDKPVDGLGNTELFDVDIFASVAV